MIYVVGGRGLVGSAIVRRLERLDASYRVLQPENREEYYDTSCDLLIDAGGNADPALASDAPMADFQASVESVATFLYRIEARTFVLLSTLDVYPEPRTLETTAEETPVATGVLSPFGFHKRLAEELVRHGAERHLILRLGSLVGPGLESGPVHDHLHAARSVQLSRESRLGVIHTDEVARLLFELVEGGHLDRTLNVGAADALRLGALEEITGHASAYDPAAESHRRDAVLDTRRLAALCALPSSAEAVRAYARDLADGRAAFPSCELPADVLQETRG